MTFLVWMLVAMVAMSATRSWWQPVVGRYPYTGAAKREIRWGRWLVMSLAVVAFVSALAWWLS